MADEMDRLWELEKHYRACACRSTTPYFSDRRIKSDAGTAHETDTAGRKFRPVFQHDRDKILYSKSFRRLRLKSQIFPEHVGDHLRTRLDHSLEVAQIARHLARQLALNEDLVDAISLGHDIGHAPFAHSGERALNKFLLELEIENHNAGMDGLKHNWQGLRVVDKLDRAYPEHAGLNLSTAVRLGIVLHTKLAYSHPEHWKNRTSSSEMDQALLQAEGINPSDARWKIFEIQIVQWADEIAQAIHELEDALVSRTLTLEGLVRNCGDWPLIAECLEDIQEKCRAVRLADPPEKLAPWRDLKQFDFADRRQTRLLTTRLRSQLIYTLAHDLISNTSSKLRDWEDRRLGGGDNKRARVQRFNDLIRDGAPFEDLVGLGAEYKSKFDNLRQKFRHLLVNSERVQRMDAKAERIIIAILNEYKANPPTAPDTVLEYYAAATGKKEKDLRSMPADQFARLASDRHFIRAAIDYVAGMTDRFALREFDRLFSAYPRDAV